MLPLKVKGPLKFPGSISRAYAPLITPLKVNLLLTPLTLAKDMPEAASVILLVIVCVWVVFALAILPASVILPPERVMLPEAVPKVMPAELTLPETVIVPVARPAEAVPKFSASEVVVVMEAPGVDTPVASVLHWLTVGAAQVPPAVPKPAVLLLVSQ